MLRIAVICGILKERIVLIQRELSLQILNRRLGSAIHTR
jgi:hypothetical protein